MSDASPDSMRRAFPVKAAVGLFAFFLFARTVWADPGTLAAQGLGSLVSPGPLSKAHAKLEGLDNCQKCHEPGKRVTAQKCLECHKPIAERIAARKGVHREAGNDCISCHVEHAGVGADTRRISTKIFDHAKETGFDLVGKHVRVECASCATCHPVTVAFKETQKLFDHAKTAYPLTGAHMRAACEKCHVAKAYKGVKFASCADCHKDPHAKPLGTCVTCHVTESFKARPPLQQAKFDHAKTGYALVGRHAAVACASCHVKPATKVHLKFARCADCHQDVHKGVFKTLDCSSCHKETGFKGGSFDHTA